MILRKFYYIALLSASTINISVGATYVNEDNVIQNAQDGGSRLVETKEVFNLNKYIEMGKKVLKANSNYKSVAHAVITCMYDSCTEQPRIYKKTRINGVADNIVTGYNAPDASVIHEVVNYIHENIREPGVVDRVSELFVFNIIYKPSQSSYPGFNAKEFITLEHAFFASTLANDPMIFDQITYEKKQKAVVFVNNFFRNNFRGTIVINDLHDNARTLFEKLRIIQKDNRN